MCDQKSTGWSQFSGQIYKRLLQKESYGLIQSITENFAKLFNGMR